MIDIDYKSREDPDESFKMFFFFSFEFISGSWLFLLATAYFIYNRSKSYYCPSNFF